jgi:hypothetical protein
MSISSALPGADQAVWRRTRSFGRITRRKIGALFREPLLHFIVLGTSLFVIWPFIADRVAPPSNAIVISSSQMQRALDIFRETHLRPPTPDELSGLIEDQIHTEVYYREGVALGLDRDDEIIRRRVVQKLEFMTQDTVSQTVPSDAELQRYLDRHPEDFGGENEIVFSQIYLDPERHGHAIERDAARLLERLNAGDGRLDYGVDSDLLPVPNDFEATPLHIIAATFGSDFARAIASSKPGQWAGPIRSGYGLHLVLVRERRLGTPPKLSRVRAAVLREWQSAQRVEANQDAYRRMRAKYAISVEMPAAQLTTAASAR